MDVDGFPPDDSISREMEIDTEVTESSSTGSMSSSKVTSSVWNHFDKANVGDKQIATCKKCSQKYAASGTTNLIRHIEKLCRFRDPANSRVENSTFSQDVFREKLSKAMVLHNQPFKFAEYQGFRDVFSYLNSQVNHICRNTAKADILKIYHIEKEKLKKTLESVHGRICLTSDLWTSIATNSYMTVTAHYVDNNWALQSKVLIFRAIPPKHDGKRIGEKLISFLQEWGIERKVLTLTLDNAGYNDGVVRLLRNHLRLTDSLICDGKYVHVRCGAHILNLVVQSGLKTIDESVNKIRETVKYVRGSEYRTLRFVECVKHLGLQTRQKLKQDLPFRWNSTYMMIESALLYKRAFLSLYLFDSNYDWCPSSDEWERVEKIALFLQPFFEMTKNFSGTKYPTANIYFLHVWKIQQLIQGEMKSTDEAIKKMAKEMKPKFDKYWDTYSTILSFAIVLDPRYKLLYVKFAYEKLDKNSAETKLNLLKSEMKNMFEDYLHASPLTLAQSPNASEGDNGMCYDPFDEFEIFKRQHGVTRVQSQLDAYLEETPLDQRQNLDVLEYWRGNLSKYPELALMARDILSIPITSVASESAFSHGGRILGKYRSSLSPKNAEAQICTQNWLEVLEEDEEVADFVDLEKLVVQIGSTSLGL